MFKTTDYTIILLFCAFDYTGLDLDLVGYDLSLGLTLPSRVLAVSQSYGLINIPAHSYQMSIFIVCHQLC